MVLKLVSHHSGPTRLRCDLQAATDSICAELLTAASGCATCCATTSGCRRSCGSLARQGWQGSCAHLCQLHAQHCHVGLKCLAQSPDLTHLTTNALDLIAQGVCCLIVKTAVSQYRSHSLSAPRKTIWRAGLTHLLTHTRRSCPKKFESKNLPRQNRYDPRANLQ